jgi:uncharacterized membrane protein YjfL (UPF0719 family)
MNMIYWDHYYNTILLLNLLIVIGLFTSLRLFSGVIVHINPTRELLTKDNPAFGISLAAATFAITIILSGTIYGSPENDAIYSIIAVGVFGILGVMLMALTRLIFDRITLPSVHLREEIVGGNVAVAIADAGNVIAAAIIIRAVMIWVTVNSFEGILALLGAYAVSQFLLTGMTVLRMRVFGMINKGNCTQEELRGGNTALALKFAGQKTGMAFALATASQIVVYEEYEILPILATWFFASIAVILAWKALCFLAENIILFRVDTGREILAQKNIAVGMLVGIIHLCMGILLSAL